MKKQMVSALISVLTAGTLALSGCGSSTSESTVSTESATESSTAAATETTEEDASDLQDLLKEADEEEEAALEDADDEATGVFPGRAFSAEEETVLAEGSDGVLSGRLVLNETLEAEADTAASDEAGEAKTEEAAESTTEAAEESTTETAEEAATEAAAEEGTAEAAEETTAEEAEESATEAATEESTTEEAREDTTEAAEESATEAAPEEETGETEEEETEKSSGAAGLEGDWVLAGYQTFFNESDAAGAYHVAVTTDSDTEPQGSIKIYEQDGKLLADYTIDVGDDATINGMTVSEKDQAAPEGSTEESAASADLAGGEDSRSRTLYLVSDDVLKLTDSRIAGPHTVYTFCREGSDAAADSDDLQYTNTVTVSTIQELVAAIDDGTKIVLSEGTYDFSDLTEEDLTNEHVRAYINDSGLQDAAIRGVRNLGLVAEDGADVTIVTESTYMAPLSILDSEYVTLRDLTVTFKGDEGASQESSVYARRTRHLTIDGCHLAGNGTYGIETSDVTGMTVTDTDLSGYTSGLVSLTDTGSAAFSDCTMKDSSGAALFVLDGCWAVAFENCQVENNTVSEEEDAALIDCTSSYNITFTGCSLEDNTYSTLLNEEARTNGYVTIS